MEIIMDEAINGIEKRILPIFDNDADHQSLVKALDTMRKYQQLEDFARWVAGEIIDEDMWVLNYLAFAELACRKLVKLGIIQESNGEYLYEEVEDGEDNIHQ